MRVKFGLFNSQRGQVLPLSLGVLAVACVTFLLVFNSGRAVNEKINLVNAADASAYSGAQIAARHLNFMAYTNRAMIANEAAIGHLYSFQVEMQMLGNVVQEGATGGGIAGDIVRWLLDIIIGGNVVDNTLDLLARVIQPIVDGSQIFTGMLSLMLDANNASFANFQEQAYQDLIQKAPNSSGTIIDQTMSAVAKSYINRPTAPIEVNNTEVLRDFQLSNDINVAQAALEASSTAAALCEMILFATPGVESGNPLGTANAARAQNCARVADGGELSISIPGTPLAPEADGGLMIDAVRQTVATMENATWIRDRNVDNYSLFGLFRVDRAGGTEVVYNNNTKTMNWQASNDSLAIKVAGIQLFRTTESGDAATNVDEATALVDRAAIQGLRLFGLCSDGGDIDCEELAENSYDSIQRYAALDPNRQRATITAFLSQDNCSDGIGFDDDGNRNENWSDQLQRFEDRETFCGKNIYAIGQAEVYFQRPDCYESGNTTCSQTGHGFSRVDSNGSVEVPNLYNPFWHARLIASGSGG